MTASRSPSRAAPDRGVTLVEILVVLALMATLMGLGISMYTNLGKQGVFTASVGRVLSTVNRVRMVGAVRATTQCLDCHRVERGALLGAFSYDLWRTPPLKGEKAS